MILLEESQVEVLEKSQVEVQEESELKFVEKTKLLQEFPMESETKLLEKNQ